MINFSIQPGSFRIGYCKKVYDTDEPALQRMVGLECKFLGNMDLLAFITSAAAFTLHARGPSSSRFMMGTSRATHAQSSSGGLNRTFDITKFLALSQIATAVQTATAQTPPLLGLLFAASWCGDCWDTVPVLEKLAQENPTRIQVVYISSDESEQQMMQYIKPDIFSYVPFSNVQERTQLKKHFETCAKKEMQSIGMSERKHGTPTLFIIDRVTGRIVTESGVDDFMKADMTSAQVVEQWIKAAVQQA